MEYADGESTQDGKLIVNVKSGKGFLGKSHYWAWFKMFGTSFYQFGNIAMIESVYSDRNLVRIKGKNHDIVTNVPNVKEFAEQVMEAVEKRKANLKP